MTAEEKAKLPEESIVINDDEDVMDKEIMKLPMDHISGIMEYLQRQNHKSEK